MVVTYKEGQDLYMEEYCISHPVWAQDTESLLQSEQSEPQIVQYIFFLSPFCLWMQSVIKLHHQSATECLCCDTGITAPLSSSISSS